MVISYFCIIFVKQYKGLYQVSNTGLVRSLGMWVNGNGGSKYWRNGRILKCGNTGRGYLMVVLTKNENRKTHIVHRLVAQAFIPNPNNLPQVNHKDECKTNNNVSNLEWCDNKYNSNYGERNKKIIDTKIKKR